MNLSDLPTDYVQQVASYRNNIPRKSLNYKTPLEVSMKYITNEHVVFSKFNLTIQVSKKFIEK